MKPLITFHVILGRRERIVAARSYREAVERLRIKPNTLRSCGGPVGDRERTRQALLTPGAVWERGLAPGSPWTECAAHVRPILHAQTFA